MGDYRDLIYSDDWRNWTDPEVPEYFNPTHLLLDRHIGTPVADKTALIVDRESYSYAEFLSHVCRAADGLAAQGIAPGTRMLMFGTDSLEYLALWFGAIRAGVVPV